LRCRGGVDPQPLPCLGSSAVHTVTPRPLLAAAPQQPDRPPSRSCGSARLVRAGQRQRRGGQRDADQLGGESGCAVRAGGGWPRHRDQSVAHADLHGTPLAGPRRYAFPPLPPRRRPTRACVEANQSGAAAAAAGVGLYDWHATQSLLALGTPLFLAVSIPCWCAPPSPPSSPTATHLLEEAPVSSSASPSASRP